MHKLLILISVTLLLNLASAALANDLPSPAQMLKAGQFSLSVSGAWQSEQKFKDADLKFTTVYSDSEREAGSRRLNDFKIKDDQFYLATLSYGLTDWLSFSARAGLASGGKEQYAVTNNGRTAAVEVRLKDCFAWGLGARGRIFETASGLGATLSLQYLRYDDRKEDNLSVNGAAIPQDRFDFQAEYQQVDAVAALYQRLGAFMPYVGLGYTWSRFQYSGNDGVSGDYSGTSDFSSANQENLAALVGCDLALGERLSLNVQGSFVSRTAVGLGLTYLF